MRGISSARHMSDEVAQLRAENESLRAQLAALQGGAAGEAVTLESLNAKLNVFIEKSQHHMAHSKSDDISNDVQALSEAESKLTEQQIAQAREVFDSYDKDGSGAISADELRELMLVLGERPDPARLQKMVEEVDDNNNGVIDFTEFLTLFAILVGEAEETADIKKIKLGSMSYYGRAAL
eukprot:COSAG05_NODE_1790_length_4082_cov_21.604162_5_plen_179_part_01